jgi:hypothetical protein
MSRTRVICHGFDDGNMSSAALRTSLVLVAVDGVTFDRAILDILDDALLESPLAAFTQMCWSDISCGQRALHGRSALVHSGLTALGRDGEEHAEELGRLEFVSI